MSVNDAYRAPKILVLDGGGLRGFFSLQILKEMEHRLEQPLHEAFDMIIGTSTGAIIASALGILKYSASEVESVYKQFGQTVFGEDSFIDYLTGTVKTLVDGVYYDASKLEQLLNQVYERKRLNHRRYATPYIAMVAADMTCSPGSLFVFSNYPRDGMPFEGSNAFLVRDAIRASTAAPFFFDAFQPNNNQTSSNQLFVDGGLIANNPSQVGYLEAKKLFQGNVEPIVVSVGTGRGSSVRHEGIKEQWLKTTASVTLETAMATHHTTAFMDALLGENYFRINGPVTNTPMDLYEYVESWIKEGKTVARSYRDWDRLVESLKSN